MLTRNVASYFTWSRYRWRFVRWARASGMGLDPVDAEQLAQLLAAHTVEHRLDGAPQLRDAWVRARTVGTPYTPLEQAALRAYLAPFAPDVNPDHRQGTVAEYLWHVLSIEDTDEAALVRIRGPKVYTTGPGGDGLTGRRDGRLFFTLWEIKKHTGAHLSIVINDAYGRGYGRTRR